VIKVVRRDPGLVVTVESPPAPMGCPQCGVIAASHGRRSVVLVDAPAFGRPARNEWRKRMWRCAEPACPGRLLTEQNAQLCRPRALMTSRACWWAINQLRTEHASVSGLARQLGTTWRTVWRSIVPLLEAMAADPARFSRVSVVDAKGPLLAPVVISALKTGAHRPYLSAFSAATVKAEIR
jgi:hypothetical protein